MGDEVPLDVYTHFVGSGSKIRISIYNKSGRRLERIDGKIYANHFRTKYAVSDRAKDAIYFEAELRKHGLKQKSEEMKIIPPVKITNVQWSAQEARRGDVLQLTADVEGAPDGTEALIEVWEHDEDEAHDFITKMPTMVENKRIEISWMYQYFEDTDEIPTEEEVERGYNSPEYFFKVIIGSKEERSELLEFKDWIDIVVRDEAGQVAANYNYTLHLPDDQEKSGTTDDNGRIREEDIPPGPWWIELLGPEDGSA